MKKTLLLVTILVSLFAQGMKADEYTTALEEMVRQGVVAVDDHSSTSDLKKSVPQLAEYLDGQYYKDVVEILVPYYRENCSVEEMKQMCAYLTSSENKALMTKILDSTDATKELVQKELGPIVQTLMMGGTVKDIEPVECSKEYGEALDKLFSIQSLDKYAQGNTKAMMQSMSKMMSGLAGMLGGTDSNDSDFKALTAQLEGPMKYLDKNMPTIIRNACIKSLTLEDIQKASKVQDEPFYPAMKRVNEAMYSDMANITDKLLDLVMPKMKDAFGGIVKAIGGLED